MEEVVSYFDVNTMAQSKRRARRVVGMMINYPNMTITHLTYSLPITPHILLVRHEKTATRSKFSL